MRNALECPNLHTVKSEPTPKMTVPTTRELKIMIILELVNVPGWEFDDRDICPLGVILRAPLIFSCN